MVDSSQDNLQQTILNLLDKNGEIADTNSLVDDKISAQMLDAALKSLNVDEYVTL